MRIGVIVAMEIEFRKMLEALGGNAVGRMGDNEVVLVKSEIGKVNAAVGTMKLIQQYAPVCIVSTGLAGGVDASVNVMDIVVGVQTAYHDVWCGEGNMVGQVQGLPPRFDAHLGLVRVAQEVKHRMDIPVHMGLICTGDQFVTDKVQLATIKSRFSDALACEMESTAIAQTCYLMGVPFLSIRVISDTPGNTDNHQLQWEDFLGSMTDKSFRFVTQFLQMLPNALNK